VTVDCVGVMELIYQRTLDNRRIAAHGVAC
jgi:hypothetical protein